MKELLEELYSMQDIEYKKFQAKLLPTVNPNSIIGIRTPNMRKFAKDFAKTKEAKEFLKILPHDYYDENNLHAFIIESIKDFDTALLETERFLPYIDNWATCDIFVPKVFKKNTDLLLPNIKTWITSDHVYTVRYGIGLLMGLFLDDKFTPDLPLIVANVHSDEYYINMMIAWYFATALAKQYDSALPFILNNKLDKWVHNKTIQKAVESNRISDDVKTMLKSLRIK